MLREEGVERIPGAHCYEFFASPSVFAALSEAEPGTFYLTDFLLRHFDRLVTKGLGIDRHPELAAMYFGNYRRIMYLAQTAPTAATLTQGREIADSLGLAFEYRQTGYGALGDTLTALTGRTSSAIQWHP